MMTTPSTLVETVSIDYEDFTEGFLTCGTCLNTYDSDQHAPKLLTCSHTLCKLCLESICNQPGVPENGAFRCPICRELIHLPRGEGSISVNFPPSFMVNQLLDLVSRQRRDVIPKCIRHVTQELLFCETCDKVFCLLCDDGSSHSTINCKHTVIPFAVAIKRLSEILMYKGQQCIAKYNEAHKNVTKEILMLEQNADQTASIIKKTFQEIIDLVEKRCQEVLSIASKMKEDKLNILMNQMKLIEEGKSEIVADCENYEQRVEIRHITRKIEELHEKMDKINVLLEPRENCFIHYEHPVDPTLHSIQSAICNFGSVRSSSTFPPLCEANIDKCFAKLRSIVNILTYDYAGSRQKYGGDPVTAELRCLSDGSEIPVRLVDKCDGTYEAHFIAPRSGKYCFLAAIFGRPIKNYPLEFEAVSQINPVCIYGARGDDQHGFLQPVSIAISEIDNQIYVLDTGNCRLKILSQNDCNNSPFTFVSHIDGLDRTVTGMALVPRLDSSTKTSILISNWDTQTISEINESGKVLRYFSHRDLREPTHLCVNSKREIIVADNGAKTIFIFYPCGKMRRRLACNVQNESNNSSAIQGSKISFGVIGAVTIGPDDEIVVADSRIRIFTSDGSTLLREIATDSCNKGDTYGGLCYDNKGQLLATKSERGKVYVQIFDYYSGQLKFTIDSVDAKLKRASDLATTDDYHVIVVDLGNDCIKKYRYF